MPLGIEVGLDQSKTMLDGGPAPLPKKGAEPLNVCCGQMAGWIMMALGTEVGIGPGNVVLDGIQFPPKRCTTPSFRPVSIVAKRLDG